MLVVMFPAGVNNNCNDYYSGYSELSVGEAKKGMVGGGEGSPGANKSGNE